MQQKEVNLDEEAGSVGPPFVSTGDLPPPGLVRALVAEAYERFKTNSEGRVSDVYPSLAAARGDLFGVCVVGASGAFYASGDFDRAFPIMSVSKPFVFALICQLLGGGNAREKIGVNATGLAFNSLAAVERGEDGRTNPMVNSGAIATTSLVPGVSREARWRFILDGLSRFAGRPLSLNTDVFACAMESNHRNQAIAQLLQAYGRVYMDPAEAVELYTRQCSLDVSARDLAVMGATLADGGVNPITKARAVDEASCKFALATMATAGLTRPRATGSTRSGCRARAELAAGSSRLRRARAALEPSPPCSTQPETASRDALPRNSCPIAWDLVCSPRGRGAEGARQRFYSSGRASRSPRHWRCR